LVSITGWVIIGRAGPADVCPWAAGANAQLSAETATTTAIADVIGIGPNLLVFAITTTRFDVCESPPPTFVPISMPDKTYSVPPPRAKGLTSESPLDGQLGAFGAKLREAVTFLQPSSRPLGIIRSASKSLTSSGESVGDFVLGEFNLGLAFVYVVVEAMGMWATLLRGSTCLRPA
jgi:hypothetical protein